MNATGTKKGEDAKHKRCKPVAQGGCGKLKSRLKEFKPRWGKCEKHRDQGLSKDDPKVAKCEECKKVRAGFVRQPLCVECDSKRGKKDGKKGSPAKVTAHTKKAKTSKAAPAVAAPPAATAPVAQSVPPPVAATVPTPAPAPVVQHTAPPASPPTPAPSPSSALGAVSALLEGGKEGSADDSAGPAQQAAPALETPVGVNGAGAAVSTPVLEKPAMKTGKKKAQFVGPPPQGPTIIHRGSSKTCEHGVAIRDCTQGCTGRKYAQAGLCDIKRLFRALTTRNTRLARAEERLQTANTSFKEVIAEARAAGGLESSCPETQARYEAAHEKREFEIARVNNARAWREFTAKRLRMFLDHALANTPFTKARECPDGKCEKCNFTGMLRDETKSPYAKAATPILRHLSTALEVAELCYKVRARTSEKDEAYRVLLERHMGVVKKFGNPKQTALEGDDAEQGAMIGLMDGAVRYDPTEPIQYYCPVCGHKEKIKKRRVNEFGEPDEKGKKKRRVADPNRACPNSKCEAKTPMMVLTSVAKFQTVAWSWSRRNSRARKTTDERPGLRPSIDDPSLGGKKAEDGGLADQVAVVDGKARIVGEKTKIADTVGLASMDLHTQINALEDEDQKTIVRYLLDGRTPSEISEILGISSRQVAKTKEAAFALLRERLGQYLGRARSQVEEEVEVS